MLTSINGRECGDNLPAAAELLAGLGEEAPGEFEMQADEKGGSAADVAAVEIEDGADAEHDAAAEVRAEALHELLLLGSAEGYPDDVYPLLLQCGGDGGVVKILHSAERERSERHICHGGIPGRDGSAKVGEGGIICAEEGHAVLPCTDDIAEDLGAAVLLPLDAIKSLEIKGNPAAIADGEEGFAHGGAVGGIAVHHGEDIAIRHADVGGTILRQSLADAGMNGSGVELVANLEVGFHGESVLFLGFVFSGLIATESLGFGVLGMGYVDMRKGIGSLFDAIAAKDLVDGVEENLDVEGEGETLLIAQVVGNSLAEGEVVSALYLSQTGDAGANAHAVTPHADGECFHLLRHPGTRADEAHVPHEHVEELRQFIQRGAAQDFADEGGALFIRE